MRPIVVAFAVAVGCLVGGCDWDEELESQPAADGVGGAGLRMGEPQLGPEQRDTADQGLTGNKLLDPQTDGAPSVLRGDKGPPEPRPATEPPDSR